MARILLVANKWFEADPLMSVLSNPDARAPGKTELKKIVWPRIRPAKPEEIIPEPRCQIELTGSGAVIEVWCIEDLMGPSPPVSHSSTSEKQKALEIIFSRGRPDAVIAFGTGTYPGEVNNNGNVSVGGTVFLHQPSGPPNHDSTWVWAHNMEKLVFSSLSMQFLSDMKNDTALTAEIYRRWLVPRVNPAPAEILAEKDAVAISSVNIISNADYARVDGEAIAIARTAGATEIGSVETTHGVIRAQSDAPFLFVTGIPNRFGHFTDEALGNYPQNFVAAHNAGVLVSYLLPRMAGLLDQGKQM
jgi:hypothetical protein